MTNLMFRAFNSLQAIVKRFTVLLVSLVVFLGLTQTAVLAANHSDTNTKPYLGVPGIESIRDEDNSAAKEERREWQSKVSSAREDKANKPDTLGEKLNVDELAKGYDPEREAEKRSASTP